MQREKSNFAQGLACASHLALASALLKKQHKSKKAKSFQILPLRERKVTEVEGNDEKQNQQRAYVFPS